MRKLGAECFFFVCGYLFVNSSSEPNELFFALQLLKIQVESINMCEL